LRDGQQAYRADLESPLFAVDFQDFDLSMLFQRVADGQPIQTLVFDGPPLPRDDVEDL